MGCLPQLTLTEQQHYIRKTQREILQISDWHEEHARKAVREELSGRSGSAIHKIEQQHAEGLYRRIQELRLFLAQLRGQSIASK